MNGIIKRMKEKTKTIVYYGGKIKARIKDCAVLFASAHLLRELINGSELDLIRKEECDKKFDSNCVLSDGRIWRLYYKFKTFR